MEPIATPGMIDWIFQERQFLLEVLVIGAGCATIATLMALFIGMVWRGKEMK